ncbi:MAG: YkgJ family cysteine cluster protein [Planctomycetes bacterium]|nr:YkgJ family cysteine cluster protein [Planctomycetota bacterium]
MTYDCQSCGACCASPFDAEGYIPVQPDEEAHLSRLGLPVLEIVAAPPEDRLVLLGTRINTQRRRVCAAFSGSIGSRCTCTIYQDRPTSCRQFEAGSAECLQARRASGIAC